MRSIKREIFKSSNVALFNSVPVSFTGYNSSSQSWRNHDAEHRYGDQGKIRSSGVRQTLIKLNYKTESLAGLNDNIQAFF